VTGMQRLSYKERRKARRQNHIAKDLGHPKYKQRVVRSKKKDVRGTEFDEEEY